MTLALRLLAYVSLFRVLGPLLVTVLAMFADAARFSGVLLVVIVGWANGACTPTSHLHHMHPSTPRVHPARAPHAHYYYMRTASALPSQASTRSSTRAFPPPSSSRSASTTRTATY